VTPDAGQVTELLEAWSQGNQTALQRLAPLVYAELRKLARFHMSHEAPSHTLQATALINETFLKLADLKKIDWNGRQHFFATSSQIMRRVLVDYARQKRSIKRGRDVKRVSFEDAGILRASGPAASDLLVLDDALSRLEVIDTRKARVLEFWFFGGLTVEEIADTLEVGTSTVKRDLDFAKVWLARELWGAETHDR
jgi:RNA polymerase sigma factor (TIGR02999 family)